MVNKKKGPKKKKGNGSKNISRRITHGKMHGWGMPFPPLYTLVTEELRVEICHTAKLYFKLSLS